MRCLFTLFLFGAMSCLFAQTSIDFTNPTTATYGVEAQATVLVGANPVSIMRGGDVNGDQRVRYSDNFIPPATFVPSDAITIFNVLGGNPIGQMDGYHPADVNMDGKVRYTDLFLFPATFIPSDGLKIFNFLDGDPAAETVQQF